MQGILLPLFARHLSLANLLPSIPPRRVSSHLHALYQVPFVHPRYCPPLPPSYFRTLPASAFFFITPPHNLQPAPPSTNNHNHNHNCNLPPTSTLQHSKPLQFASLHYSHFKQTDCQSSSSSCLLHGRLKLTATSSSPLSTRTSSRALTGALSLQRWLPSTTPSLTRAAGMSFRLFFICYQHNFTTSICSFTTTARLPALWFDLRSTFTTASSSSAIYFPFMQK